MQPDSIAAARFAAKEALAKALGAGGGMSWTDAEVRTDDVGRPSLDVRGTVVLAGHVAAGLLRNLASTVLVVAVAIGIGFRPHASAGDFAAALGVLLFFVAAVSWLAAAFGLLVRAPEAANSATFFLMFFCYASSAFVPVRTMPTWLRGFAEHQPATPITETIRGLLLGHASPLPLASALAWCAGIAVVSIALSAILFRRRTAA